MRLRNKKMLMRMYEAVGVNSGRGGLGGSAVPFAVLSSWERIRERRRTVESLGS